MVCHLVKDGLDAQGISLAGAAIKPKDPQAHPLCSLHEEWLDSEDDDADSQLVALQFPSAMLYNANACCWHRRYTVETCNPL